MSNIPCKNCITFAVCNAQISDDFPHLDVVDKLLPKCSLIKNYTKKKLLNPYGRSYSLYAIEETVKFFKL